MPRAPSGAQRHAMHENDKTRGSQLVLVEQRKRYIETIKTRSEKKLSK